MIKSRHNTFGCWLVFLVSIFFFSFLVLGTLAHYSFINLTFFIKLDDKSFYVMVIVFCFFLIIFLLIISAHVKNVAIDISSKKISFQNIISRRTKTYSFADFDGFVDTFLNHQAAQYKTIGFVKDKKVVRYLDSFWFSNYSDLREALSSSKYLGTYNFGTWKRIKLLLRMQILD